MKNTITKIISFILIGFLVFQPVIFTSLVLAEDEPTLPVQNTADVNTDTTASSDTGNNEIALSPEPTPVPTPEPTPTPSPEALIEPTPEPSPQEPLPPDPSPTPTLTPANDNLGVGSSAQITNSVSSDVNSGNNTVSAPQGEDLKPAPSPASSPDVQIKTEDALSQTNIENGVNTTLINSQSLIKTINLFVDSQTNIDLSNALIWANQILAENPNEEVINVAVGVDNISYLANDVASLANTGGNQINAPDANAAIETGDAYSLVTLLNKMNLTLVNSTLQFVTINIFGNLDGNIILPSMSGAGCNQCAGLNTSNLAQVTNNVNSAAISGENSIEAESGSITTSDSQSIVNLTNIVNTTIQDASLSQLFINLFGSWTGAFLGWGDMEAYEGGTSLSLTNIEFLTDGNCESCAQVSEGSISNMAVVENNISSLANSGGNQITSEDGLIKTGVSYSLVSLMNFINSTFVNSNGFFGFINVFGSWTGDIGDAEKFADQTKDPPGEGGPTIPPPDDIIKTSNPPEQGGQLSITQTNNVGEGVNPGDTVTFFVNVKNTGTGKIYDSKLKLFLIQDGKNMGGREYYLGDIEAGKEVLVTTGFVLTKNAPSGLYTARSLVAGYAGDKEVSAFADSFFKIFGVIVAGSRFSSQGEVLADSFAETVVASSPSSANTKSKGSKDPIYLVLGLLTADFVLIRIFKKIKR